MKTDEERAEERTPEWIVKYLRNQWQGEAGLAFLRDIKAEHGIDLEPVLSVLLDLAEPKDVELEWDEHKDPYGGEISREASWGEFKTELMPLDGGGWGFSVSVFEIEIFNRRNVGQDIDGAQTEATRIFSAMLRGETIESTNAL